jgi:DNA invertase Pin-like site-specific DNA recombinase
MKTAIAYVRVSTGKQSRSGLGLEAQQATIKRFAEQEGFEIVQTFTEVQSAARTMTTAGHSSRPRWRWPGKPRRPSSSRSSIG